MLQKLSAAGTSFGLLLLVAWTAADEEITLVIPGIQCPRCVESISGSLSRLESVKIGRVGTETKQMPVTYDPSKVTLHELAQATAQAPPVHGRPYEAGVLVTIDEPAKSAAKVKRALTQVRGLSNFYPAPGSAPDSGEIFITLRPLSPNAKPNEFVKAVQIADALEKAGLKFSGLPVSNDNTTGDDKSAAPGKETKGKAGGDDADKSKSTRASPPPKTRPAREIPPAKPKEKEDDAEKPRFVILAGDSEKVFLVDYETKNEDGKELKKLVKKGDAFGSFIVKQVGDDDGLFVVLEQAETEIRVEQKKKSKDGDSTKDEKESKGEETKAKEKP